MGSYICVGFVSREKYFKNRIIKIIDCFNESYFKRVCYPKDINCDEWITCDSNECDLYTAIEYLCMFEFSQIHMDFVFNEYYIKNAIIQIETREDVEKCVIVQIPEDNDMFKNIDTAEMNIIELLKKLIGTQFDYGFCDSEASLFDNHYSILMECFNEHNIKYESWKIDGLTLRG